MSKLTKLAQSYGYDDPVELAGEYIMDCCAPGICTNPGCDYTAKYEQDQRAGWCEVCETATVESLFSMLMIV